MRLVFFAVFLALLSPAPFADDATGTTTSEDFIKRNTGGMTTADLQSLIGAQEAEREKQRLENEKLDREIRALLLDIREKLFRVELFFQRSDAGDTVSDCDRLPELDALLADATAFLTIVEDTCTAAGSGDSGVKAFCTAREAAARSDLEQLQARRQAVADKCPVGKEP